MIHLRYDSEVKIYYPRTDFIIVEDYFTPLQAHSWLKTIDELGQDEVRGYHHPLLKPNRFHKAPKYPVKKFMCLGLYWDPLDYLYHEKIPGKGSSPHSIPKELTHLSSQILEEFYPTTNFIPQSVMVNFYTKDSSMGLHVDKDEPNKTAPIIGLNFGSTCRFFFEDEGGEIKETKIPGNSIYVFGKTARHMRHGLGTIFSKSLSSGSEFSLKNKERLNLTIRQVY
jgi:alkylated DNA repair dioxygenase AlkB